ncbi:hypothetical protein ACIRBX_37575 [Kitasatospora sp. NPDC096147]|uniref:hypothetical protein n=1 Tax=Kitasatospora sp. NPDC096147 TaxID=3364093 RepID=UPI003816D79C
MPRTALVLLATAVVLLFALLVAAGAAKLARLEGAGRAAAVRAGAVAFAGTVTLVLAGVSVLAEVLG